MPDPKTHSGIPDGETSPVSQGNVKSYGIAQSENSHHREDEPTGAIAKEPENGSSKADGFAKNPQTMPNLNFNLESLPSVDVGVQDKPNVKEPSLPIIGFNLSNFVLFIITGFIVLLVIFLFVKEFDASSSIKIPTEANISDSTYARKLELVRMIQEEKKNFRDFTMQIAQMVLLNLLLPVLTAILGYIFASNKSKEQV